MTVKKKRETAPKRTATSRTRSTEKKEKKLVEIDEPRQRAGDDREVAFKLETSEGTDALAEELGEGFVENVTGANDAASEHREDALDEESAFTTATAETEDEFDYDDPNLTDEEAAPRRSV